MSLLAERTPFSPRCALEAKRRGGGCPKSRDGFLEELIVRRELADNFCFYNDKYDEFVNNYAWAQDTLRLHAADKREHLYTLEQFERAETHEALWNAAQREMTRTGKMHGFMRMCGRAGPSSLQRSREPASLTAGCPPDILREHTSILG